MGMRATTAVLDGMLDIIKTAKSINVCSCYPSSFAGVSAYRLGRSTAMTTASFTKADSSVGAANYKGRKITVTQFAGVVCSCSGSAKHVVLATTLITKYVTTCVTKALTTSDTVTVPSWAIHILQPTSST